MSKAIIVGGSIGGLLAGNILMRAGWEVDVFERARNGLEARGAGIAPQQALLDALGRAGVTVRSDIGIRVTKREAYDRAGRVFAAHAYEQYTTSWGLLYNRLLAAFPSACFHAGSSVRSLHQEPGRVTALLEDGTQVTGDLLVGADGIRSTVRQALYPETQPRYAGYFAWRGMLDERETTPDFVDAFFSGFSFSFPPGEELIGYPVAGKEGSVEKGERRFNIMWYRPMPPGPQFTDLFTGVDGVVYENGIPPHLIRPALITDMKADAQRLLPPAFAEAINRMPDMFFQAIYDLDSDRMAKGRAALIGDAAFVARPHCGAGVSKAAGDAMCLADALTRHDTVEAALTAFSAERVMAGKAAVLWASHLGSYFQMDGAGHHRPDYAPDHPPVTPDYIIRHTGIELAEAFRI